MIQVLTREEVQSKLDNGETFVLDFYADWCGPCKMLGQNLTNLVSESIRSTASKRRKRNVSIIINRYIRCCTSKRKN